MDSNRITSNADILWRIIDDWIKTSKRVPDDKAEIAHQIESALEHNLVSYQTASRMYHALWCQMIEFERGPNTPADKYPSPPLFSVPAKRTDAGAWKNFGGHWIKEKFTELLRKK